MAMAIRIHEPGGSDKMRWEEVSVGDPGPDEVKLRQTVCGLNFIDVYHRTGLYPLEYPTALGMEAAGVVEAVGDGVTELQVGDRVAYAAPPVGAYATETFRGAFLGVSPGSIEAARALGMSPLQTFIYIRIPEMWRIALPPFGNHMLSLIKDTALISVIGLNETLFVAKQAIATTNKPFTMYIFVGLIYLAFSSLITLSVMGLRGFWL